MNAENRRRPMTVRDTFRRNAIHALNALRHEYLLDEEDDLLIRCMYLLRTGRDPEEATVSERKNVVPLGPS
jgi:hypothetical protein